MEDLVRVPFFVLDCTTLFSIAPIDVDGSLRRRLSPPTFENMSIFQLSFESLNGLVMSMTVPTPSTVTASISEACVVSPEQVVAVSDEPASLHAHDILGLDDDLVSAAPLV